LIDIDFKLIVL